MAKRRDFGPLFEECCWNFDSEKQLWIMPILGRAPAIPAGLIEDAFTSLEAKGTLVEALLEIKSNYEDSETLIDPIVERLQTDISS